MYKALSCYSLSFKSSKMTTLSNVRCSAPTLNEKYKMANNAFASISDSNLVQILINLGDSYTAALKSSATKLVINKNMDEATAALKAKADADKNVRNACMFVVTYDEHSKQVRYFAALERRRNGLHVWGIPGGKRDYIPNTNQFESCWDCAQREFQEEIRVQFPPQTASTGKVSFEFSKFIIDETKYYCWFTNEKLRKGPVTDSNNNEIIFVDWARASSLMTSILDFTIPLAINPTQPGGTRIPLPGDHQAYRIRKCFSDSFKPFIN